MGISQSKRCHTGVKKNRCGLRRRKRLDVRMGNLPTFLPILVVNLCQDMLRYTKKGFQEKKLESLVNTRKSEVIPRDDKESKSAPNLPRQYLP